MFFNQLQRKRMLPLTLMLGGSLIVVLLAFHFINASANTGDIASAEAQYPNIVGSRIDTCALCHAGSPPSLNPYGAAYKAAGRNPAALPAIQGQDSDGDGFSNLVEIMALSFPGNANDVPAPPTPTPTATTMPSSTPTLQATATATGQPSATATSVGQPTATATMPGATATMTPTIIGTVTATEMTSPTPTTVGCQDDEDQEGTDMAFGNPTGQNGDDENDCEREGQGKTRMPKPTEAEHMTKTPRPTEAEHMTKTPRPTEAEHMTRTPRSTEGAHMTRTPRATEGPRMTRTAGPTSTAFPCVKNGDGSISSAYNSSGRFGQNDCGGQDGGHNGDGAGGSITFNWFQNVWKNLTAIFHR